MSDRTMALVQDARGTGFGITALMAAVNQMLQNPEALFTLARLGGAEEGERNALKLDAHARSLVKQLLGEEKRLESVSGGPMAQYGPDVLTALEARGLNTAEGRTLVRLQALVNGQSLEQYVFAGTEARPAAGRTVEMGLERLERSAEADLTAMREALLTGQATPGQMERFLRGIDYYRQRLDEARFRELVDRVFGPEAGQVRGWLDFRNAFVAGKKEYWYRVIEEGKQAADQWDQAHYEPLRAQRDAGLKDPTYGPLVQAIQNEAVAVHEGYAALYRAKEGWWRAHLNGQPTEGFAAQGAEARGRLAAIDPMAERLWGSGNTWHLDRERRAEVERFTAAYQKLMQGLIAGDGAAVREAQQALAPVSGLFGSAPHKALWRQYEGEVRSAYLEAVAKGDAGRLDLFRQSLEPALLQEWDRQARQPGMGPVEAAGYTSDLRPVTGTVPFLLQPPLAAGTYTLSSPFGMRVHPRSGQWKLHRGTDYSAKAGTAIRAAHGGEVVHVGNDPKGYGHYVILKGPDGLHTLYAHMRERPVVSVGEKVAAGDLLGYVGSTGDSTGPHLHFEVFTERGKERIYLSAEDVCFLQQGSRGDRVRELQKRLHELGYGNLVGQADGIFGPRTAEALRAFQRDQGLPVTGIADAGTLAALGNPKPRGEQRELPPLSPGIDGVVEAWRWVYGLTPEEEMAVRISASFESARGLDALAGNFDGMGVSFGFSQWNLGMGTLQSEILRPLLKEHPEVFYRHFPDTLRLQVGKKRYTMAEIINLTGAELKAVLPVIGREVENKNSPWHQAFRNLAREEAVVRLQLGSAKRMLDLAKQEMKSPYYIRSDGSRGPAKSWTLDSPVGLALLYDIRKQNGSFGKVWDEIEADLRNRKPASEEGLMRFLAWHVANGSSSKYKSDVWSRKIAIVDGGGVVHKTLWQFDWANRIVKKLGGASKNPVFPQDLDPRKFLSE